MHAYLKRLSNLGVATWTKPEIFSDRLRHGDPADWLMVGIAACLPWSTSATSILIALWILAVIPSLNVTLVRRELVTPAGGLPVVLWTLAVLGMLWADVSWSERLHGLRGFHKLLLIPLLLAHFRRSERVKWVIAGFCISACALLVLSWSVRSWTGGLWHREKADFGVPVKDYISQSGIFALCALGLLWHACTIWRAKQRWLAIALAALAVAFVANLIYVVTARTTLIVILAMLIVLVVRQVGWKGLAIGGVFAAAGAALLLASSPYLKDRAMRSAVELHEYSAGNPLTSVGLRLEYWKKSIELVSRAPLIGHGTGATETLFRRDADTTINPALITGNPHNQILGIAVQLGVMGAGTLVAMWIAHLLLFRESTLYSWLGLVVVI